MRSLCLALVAAVSLLAFGASTAPASCANTPTNSSVTSTKMTASATGYRTEIDIKSAQFSGLDNHMTIAFSTDTCKIDGTYHIGVGDFTIGGNFVVVISSVDGSYTTRWNGKNDPKGFAQSHAIGCYSFPVGEYVITFMDIASGKWASLNFRSVANV